MSIKKSSLKEQKSVDIFLLMNYTVLVRNKERRKTMDDLVKKIKRARKVIAALTQLVLEIGTLLSVVKMIVESLS